MVASTLPVTTQKFAQAVNRPGGITLVEATNSANANLEAMRGSALLEIKVILDQIHQLGTKPLLEVADLGELYDLSNSISSVAGVFGLAHLGAVAYSLCELIDRFRIHGQISYPAITVHLNSLRLMQALAPEDIRQAELVQQALRQLVESISTEPRLV